MPLVRGLGPRALCTGLLLTVVTAMAVLFSPFAHAQTAAPASDSAAALRAQADALSSRYFAALDRVQVLDAEIARNEQFVETLLARAERARANARARALLAYTSSGTELATLVDGQGTLDSARRAQLIDRVNARDEHVFAKLHDASRALRKQQRVLEDTRQAQEDAVAQLKEQGAAIDAKLAEAVQQEQAAQAAQAAAAAAAQSAATASTAPSAPAPDTAAVPSATAPQAAPSTPASPPSYSGTPGVSSHHDDPFLSCVRQRESGGNYSAVNPAGPYLGAYQFLQSTWNVTASHAGRSDLVGVPPNVATAYDQDEIAWALYQWQGTGPWGGGC